MSGDNYSCRSRILSKLVYEKKTWCNGDEMSNRTGNFQKDAKELPSSKASFNQVRFRSTLEQRRGSWQSRLLERRIKRVLTIAFFRRIWFSLSTPVDISSQPDLTSRSASTSRHKDVAETWISMNEKLNSMWWKSSVKDIHGAAFPGNPLPHLIFTGRSTYFKYRSRRFNENYSGTLRTTSRLFR